MRLAKLSTLTPGDFATVVRQARALGKRYNAEQLLGALEVLVDHKAKAVFLIQGKYRQKVSGKAESRADVMAFANLSKPFADPEPGPFKMLSKGMHPHVAKLLAEDRPFTIEKGYRLWMYYVTLGAVSEPLTEEAQATVASAAFDAVMEVLDGHRLMYLLRDYLDGVAPPDHFFYYNNGITIICDRAEKRSHSGKDILRVTNPQVINGQQTSRMLALDKEKATEASVLVKVMQVPREPGADSGDGFDTLVSRIVANTNWQNAINYADLVSNDRVQIEIERALRKVGYVYLRKRQKKSEARKNTGKIFYPHQERRIGTGCGSLPNGSCNRSRGQEQSFGRSLQDHFPAD